jgi:hypothetical protein
MSIFSNSIILHYCIRYRIKVRVIDSTDSAIFVIFDRDGVELFNMACAEMIHSVGLVYTHYSHLYYIIQLFSLFYFIIVIFFFIKSWYRMKILHEYQNRYLIWLIRPIYSRLRQISAKKLGTRSHIEWIEWLPMLKLWQCLMPNIRFMRYININNFMFIH